MAFLETRLAVGILVYALVVGVSLVRPSAAATVVSPSEGRTSPGQWRDDAPFADVSVAFADWLSARTTGPSAADAWADSVLKSPRASRLGESLLRAAAVASPELAELLASAPDGPTTSLGGSSEVEPSLRLAVAERLAQQGRYDACLVWTDGLSPGEVYSPVLLHYLRAVAAHQTVDDELAQESVDQLDDFDEPTLIDRLGPARGWVVTLIRRDLEAKQEPLPTVARRMRDVERRLALSDPEQSTQDRQQQILDELDKLIEDLEEQRRQQQQQQQAASGPGGAEPAEESRPSDLKGPGEVDRRRLVAGDEWGALPPAERERLTQAITRDLPPHYRGLIEDYFRTLAEGPDASDAEDASPR